MEDYNNQLSIQQKSNRAGQQALSSFWLKQHSASFGCRMPTHAEGVRQLFHDQGLPLLVREQHAVGSAGKRVEDVARRNAHGGWHIDSP